MMMRLAISLAAGMLIACSPQGAAEPASTSAADDAATHPVSGLEIIPLTVDTGETVHNFRVEVAASQEAQTRGLVVRTELGPDEGMIFPTEIPVPRSFWMRNTPLPLDLIFIGEDRKIRNIAAMAEPYSLTSIPSEGPVIAVLELIGGRAAELDIEPGDSVEW